MCGHGIGQTCVGRGSARERIDEPIDLVFDGPEQFRVLLIWSMMAAESETEIPIPPEPIINGVIDLAAANRWSVPGVDLTHSRPGRDFRPPLETAIPPPPPPPQKIISFRDQSGMMHDAKPPAS